MGWARFKKFWMAEEIPRWFGFSLVIVYLVGLGAVGYFGIAQVRRRSADYVRWSSLYAVTCLLDRLQIETGADPADHRVAAALQSELYGFASHIPTSALRIVDRDRRVVVSVEAAEVGTVPGDGLSGDLHPTRLEVTPAKVDGKDVAGYFFRAPLTVGRVEAAAVVRVTAEARRSSHAEPSASSAAAQMEPVFYLEAQVPAEPGQATALVNQARTLTVVLVVMGALFGLYRCLRSQLRSASRIADRLRAHRDRIEHDLTSLRLADTSDVLTTAWNELVDHAQNALEAAQRKEADTELARVLERSTGGALANALNALSDGIIYITDEVHFEYLNSAACRLFGWDMQEAKHTSLHDAHAQGIGDGVLGVVRDAARDNGSFEARTVTVEAQGEGASANSTYRVWVIPLQRAHREGECVVVIRDVSQQVRADRAREDFVTQVTHELRTPLTNIRAYAETLSSGMFDDPNIITECYNVITKETRRLSRLIEDILSVSQLEVGSIELHMDNVDLKTLLSEGVRDVRGLADEKSIDIQLVLPPKLEPIRADRDKLAVVINNLLGNGIKYTPSGGNVVVGCQFNGGEVVLTFKDNGIGIAPSEHARVFEKFQRSEDPDVQNETGTGIGLYTAREIVRQQGGDIELISEKGAGSTFLVRLPHEETRAGALSSVEEV